jgi:hypothetical protein
MNYVVSIKYSPEFSCALGGCGDGGDGGGGGGGGGDGRRRRQRRRATTAVDDRDSRRRTAGGWRARGGQAGLQRVMVWLLKAAEGQRGGGNIFLCCEMWGIGGGMNLLLLLEQLSSVVPVPITTHTMHCTAGESDN